MQNPHPVAEQLKGKLDVMSARTKKLKKKNVDLEKKISQLQSSASELSDLKTKVQLLSESVSKLSSGARCSFISMVALLGILLLARFADF